MNKKIDLSKYEGHEKKLRLDEGSRDITMINDAGQEFTVKGGHLRIVIPPDRPVGPWNEWKGGLLFDLGEKAFMGNTCIPTARLMADAPLILDAYKDKCEEVERLRKELIELQEEHRLLGWKCATAVDWAEEIGFHWCEECRKAHHEWCEYHDKCEHCKENKHHCGCAEFMESDEYKSMVAEFEEE